jgi:hypothetical protein
MQAMPVSDHTQGLPGGITRAAGCANVRERAHPLQDVIMASVTWDPETWAVENFSTCHLKNSARNQRLIRIARQLLRRSASSLPDQTESWAEAKAAYRFFDTDEISYQDIIAPHCELTRRSCRPGDVKLIICDTTELDYTSLRKTTGLGPIGNGHTRGFFLHSALMVDAGPQHQTEGLVAQEIFYRQVRSGPRKKSHNSSRSKADRESAVWGRVIDAVGRPAAGVTYKFVCDRGADDIEVLQRATWQGCGFVIRVSRLQRKVLTEDGRTLPLNEVLKEWSAVGTTRPIQVPATATSPARVAHVTLRSGTVSLPVGRLTPWLKAHRPLAPLPVGVVELLEESPPTGQKPIRWVLYNDTPVTCEAEAREVVEYYEQRWRIEELHKVLKTGCRVEFRQLQTAQRLERMVAVSSVVATRLLQLKTAARETPERPAHELVPARWIKVLLTLRKRPFTPDLTIHDFVRHLACLGGFLGRKGDGEPGWMTIWRGYAKLEAAVRND